MSSSSHEFSVTTGFGYYDGCDGAGADCKFYFALDSEASVEDYVNLIFSGTDADCPTAFHESDQTYVQVGCTADNVSFDSIFH
jgi:hypothetical protein